MHASVHLDGLANGHLPLPYFFLMLTCIHNHIIMWTSYHHIFIWYGLSSYHHNFILFLQEIIASPKSEMLIVIFLPHLLTSSTPSDDSIGADWCLSQFSLSVSFAENFLRIFRQKSWYHLIKTFLLTFCKKKYCSQKNLFFSKFLKSKLISFNFISFAELFANLAKNVSSKSRILQFSCLGVQTWSKS